jgi:hypothetical protein
MEMVLAYLKVLFHCLLGELQENDGRVKQDRVVCSNCLM